MRRIETDGLRHDAGGVPWIVIREGDYRLMRAVVKAAEAVNKFCSPRDWNALSRAIAALNAPGKGGR